MQKDDENTIGKNYKEYYRAELKHSTVDDNCIVGDFSRVHSSILQSHVRIDRNNFVLKSNINQYTYTGQFTVIMHANIGKFCSISWGVTIGAGEHDFNKITTHDFLYNTNYDLNSGKVSYDRFSKKMEIGHDVWVGTNSTIVRGVNIGNGAVIGANSVVTKDVPPYAVVAGCPAKIIKYRFSKSVVDRLESISWWNFTSEELKGYFELFSSDDIEYVLRELEARTKQ